MLDTPINISVSSLLNLRSTVKYQNGCMASIFITDNPSIDSFTFNNYGKCTNTNLLVLVDSSHDTEGTDITHDITQQNLASLISSKYTDLTKQYYIGIVCSNMYGGNSSNCKITELSVG